MPPGDDEISIRASLEDDVSRPADAAADSIGELADEVDELSARLALAQGSLHGMQNELRDTQQEARQAAARVDELGDEAEATAAQIAVLEKRLAQTNKTAGLTLGRIVSLRAGLAALKLPLYAAGATALATGLVGVAAGLSGMAGAAAPAVGALGALPGIVVALGSGLGVLTAGFSGIGAAAGVLADPTATAKETQAALAGLGHQAGHFAQQLADLAPIGRDLRTTLQEVFLPLASGALDRTLTLLPILRGELTGLATAVGGGLLGAADELAGRFDDVQLLAGANTRILALLTSTLGPLTGGLVDLAVAMTPIAERLAQDLADGLTFVAAAIERGRASGGLAAFFAGGDEAARRIVGTLVDVTVGLFNVLSIGASAGRELGGGLETAARAFRAFTESPEGVAQIAGHFERAVPTVQALGRLVVALGGALLRVGSDPTLAPLIDRVTTELVPALEAAVAGFGTGLLPALVDVALAAAEVVQALALSPLVPIVSNLAEVVRILAQSFGAMPAPVQQALLTMGAVAVTASKYKGMRDEVVKLGGSFKTVVGDIRGAAGAARNFGTALSGGPAVGAAGSIGAKLAPAFLAVRGAIVAATTASWGFVASLLANPITWVVLAVVALGAALYLLWTRSETFRNAVLGLWAGIQGLAATIWGGVVGAFQALGAAAMWVWQSVFVPFGQVVAAIFQGIWTAIQFVARIFTVAFGVMVGIGVLGFVLIGAAWNALYPYLLAGFLFVQAGFQAAWGAIQLVAGVVWNLIQAGWAILSGYLSAGFNVLAAVAGYIWGQISMVASVAWQVIQAGWQAVQAFLQPGINAVGTLFTFVFGAIRGVALAVWNAISTAASVAFTVVRGLFSGVQAAATTVFGGIRTFVNGVWTGIQSAARTAMDNVVRSINGVIRGFNAAITLANSLPGIDISLIGEIRASGAATSAAAAGYQRPDGRWAGGPVWAGQPFLVGEMGPELARIGNSLQLLGANGPELRTFPDSGQVLNATQTERVMTAAAAAPTRGGDGSTLEALVDALRDNEASMVPAPITVHTEGLTAAEAERMVVRAIREERRQRRERT